MFSPNKIQFLSINEDMFSFLLIITEVTSGNQPHHPPRDCVRLSHCLAWIVFCGCLVLLGHVWFLLLHGLRPPRLLCPWDFPGKSTEVGCHFLLQGIFLTQGLNPCLLHWQADSLPLSYQGSLNILLQKTNWKANLQQNLCKVIRGRRKENKITCL